MARHCTHKGCGQKYEKSQDDQECLYHPGPELFHEGLKIWKCCDVKKIEFEEWLKVPGCTRGRHTDVKATIPAGLQSDLSASNGSERTERTGNGVEGSRLGKEEDGATTAGAATVPTLLTEKKAEPAPTPNVDQAQMQDDTSIDVTAGTSCKRNGCQTQFEASARTTSSNNASGIGGRAGRGPEYICSYHSGIPIFHDASKGWSCCKRRVLEFDEFMKIKGCQESKGHVFAQKYGAAGTANGAKGQSVQRVDLRIDHYQTPNSIIVSFFGKNVVPDQSRIDLNSTSINLSLFMKSAPGQPGLREYRNEIPLFDEIDPASSSFQIKSTKVEVTLIKAKTGIVWPDVDARKATEVVERITYGTTNGKGGTTGAKWNP